MLTPLADTPRLHLHVADALRRQAAEAAQLGRDLRGDLDLLDAVEAMVGRVRDAARALGLVHVERAALRAVRGLRGPDRADLLDELFEVCAGGVRITPLLRPLVVVSGREDTAALHRAAEAMAASLRIVPDLATALRVVVEEDAAALVVPIGLLDGRSPALDGRLLVVSGGEQDLPSRQAAARLGAAWYVPEPLDLRTVVRLVRARLAAWRPSAWRVLVAHRTRERVDELAAALASEEVHTIPAVGGFKLLHAIEAAGPDLVVVAAPLDNLPVPELTAMLRAHHRFGMLPRLFLWEGGMVPSALTGHDVVQGQLDVAALRARVLAVLDDQRQERALREYDELTDCLSGTAVLAAADREIASARRRGEVLVAVRFELDDVAELNARGGPLAAEKALRHLARVVNTVVRETDSVGAISTAGLLLLMPGCTAMQARDRLAQVRQRFAARVAPEGRLRGATFSMGLAEGTDDVLLRAERQLLRARELKSAEGVPGQSPPLRVGPDVD